MKPTEYSPNEVEEFGDEAFSEMVTAWEDINNDSEPGQHGILVNLCVYKKSEKKNEMLLVTTTKKHIHIFVRRKEKTDLCLIVFQLVKSF